MSWLWGGNNNPYNQDNEISYINWKRNGAAREILAFTRMLTAFRRQHRIFHRREEFSENDQHTLGCPDISYHGENAWYLDRDFGSRHFALLYHASYEGENNVLYYLVCNMYWQEQVFGVPGVLQNPETLWTTGNGQGVKEEVSGPRRYLSVPGRTVTLIRGQLRREPAVRPASEFAEPEAFAELSGEDEETI